jgi:hypothetical protein
MIWLADMSFAAFIPIIPANAPKPPLIRMTTNVDRILFLFFIIEGLLTVSDNPGKLILLRVHHSIDHEVVEEYVAITGH